MNDFLSHSFLCHYGIKGMKWGIRRYQNKDGSLTDLGRKRYHKVKNIGMSKFAGMGDRFTEDENLQDNFVEMHWGRFADGDHWGTPIQFRDERFRQDLIDNNSEAFNTVLNTVNPKYGQEPGTTNNCTKCSAAMILAKKGYDYMAGRSNRGYDGCMDYWFDGGERTTYDNSNDALSAFQDAEDGEYGTIDVRHKGNHSSGHMMVYEKVSDGLNIYDGQVAKKYEGSSVADAFSQIFGDDTAFDGDGVIRKTKLNDANPNWAHMGEDSVVNFLNPGETYDNLALGTVTENRGDGDITFNWGKRYRFLG